MSKLKAQKAAKLAVSVALTAALTVMLPVAAFADPVQDAIAQADAALAKVNELSDKVAEAETDYVNAVLEQEAATAKVNEAQQKIDTATARIQELQEKLGDRARSMYRNGNTGFLDFLFNSATFKELTKNWSIFERLNQNDADMVAETKVLRKEIEEEKVVLVEQQLIAQQAEAEAQSIYEEAMAAQAEMVAVYEALTAEAAQLLAEQIAAQEAAGGYTGGNAGSVSSSGGGNVSYNAGAYNSAAGSSALERAYAMLGISYSFGSGGPSTFDCSGLVGYAITGQYGHALGSTSSIINLPHVDPSEAQPGDIVVNDHHTGIYIGNGQMIHAPQTGDVVKISDVPSNMVYVRG